MHRPRRSRHRNERGLTLIEMIVTIAIMTVAIVGIGGSLAQSQKIAGISQDQAQLQVAMRQLSDYVRDSSASGLTYKLCAKTTDYPSSKMPALPATGVTSWGVSAVTLSTAGARNSVPVAPIQYCVTANTCDSTHTCDWGVQELTLFVANGSRTLTRTIWKSAS